MRVKLSLSRTDLQNIFRSCPSRSQKTPSGVDGIKALNFASRGAVSRCSKIYVNHKSQP